MPSVTLPPVSGLREFAGTVSVPQQVVAGDSRKGGATKLSAGATIAEIDAERRRCGVSQQSLAGEAGISISWYRKVLRRPDLASKPLLLKLRRALRFLKSPRTNLPDLDRAILGAYGACLGRTAPFYGVEPADVWAASPQRGATADAHWRACSHARQAAIYLMNTGFDIKQMKLAALLGLTPAAVCLALKDVEDRRDDPAFNEMIFGAMRAMAGRDE